MVCDNSKKREKLFSDFLWNGLSVPSSMVKLSRCKNYLCGKGIPTAPLSWYWLVGRAAHNVTRCESCGMWRLCVSGQACWSCLLSNAASPSLCSVCCFTAAPFPSQGDERLFYFINGKAINGRLLMLTWTLGYSCLLLVSMHTGKPDFLQGCLVARTNICFSLLWVYFLVDAAAACSAWQALHQPCAVPARWLGKAPSQYRQKGFLIF